MSNQRKYVYQASTRRCAETCGVVQIAIHDAITQQLEARGLSSHEISEVALSAFDAARITGTEVLRSALVECEGERMEAEDKVEQLESAVFSLEREIDRLRDELQHAEMELATQP